MSIGACYKEPIAESPFMANNFPDFLLETASVICTVVVIKLRFLARRQWAYTVQLRFLKIY
jgi:hypothetical protein